MGKLMVGAAKVDVTPPESLLPCYTNMGHLLTAIHDHIYVRVIAVKSEENNLMFIEGPVDISSFTEALIDKVRELGFRPEQVIMSSTSTHNYPCIPKKTHPSNRERDRATREFMLPFCTEKYIQAIEQAVSNMREAKYGHGSGACYTNCERCMTLPNGYGIEAPVLGAPVNRTMQILKFVDIDDNPIANVIHYNIGGAPLFLGEAYSGEGVMITDELLGMMLEYFDKRVSGDSVSVCINGANGNTTMINQTLKYDMDGMPVDIQFKNGILYDIVEGKAQETAIAALNIYKNIDCNRTSFKLRTATGEMAFPEQELFTGPRGSLNVVLAHCFGVYPGPTHPRTKNLVASNGGVCPLFPDEEFPPKLRIPKKLDSTITVSASMLIMDDIALFIPTGAYYGGIEKKCMENAKTDKFMFIGSNLLVSPTGTNPGPVYDDEHKNDLGYQRMHSRVYPGTSNSIVTDCMLKLFDKIGIEEAKTKPKFIYN